MFPAAGVYMKPLTAKSSPWLSNCSIECCKYTADFGSLLPIADIGDPQMNGWIAQRVIHQ
jgi:hypothetical protein